MAENKVIDTITPSPIPGKEERKNYVVPLIKTDGAEPVGCNVNLKELLDAEATQEELDAKADKIYVDEELKKKVDVITQAETDRLQNEEIGNKANASDVTLALNDKVDKSVYDIEMPKKADKTASELLLMTTDTPVFTTDAEGFPVPDGQLAKVHIDKRNLEGDVTIEGKAVGTNVLDFSVEPKDMAEEGIVLKNVTDYDNTEVTFSKKQEYYGGVQISDYTDDSLLNLVGHKLYASHDVKITKKPSGTQGMEGSIKISTVPGPRTAISKLDTYTRVSNISLYDGGAHHCYGFVFCLNGTKGEFVEGSYKNHMLIDITALSEKYPQYSDEQLKAILDESLPYISAQQSVTLGGVCRLENLVPNPFSTEGWSANRGALVKDGNLLKYTINSTAGNLGGAGLKKIHNADGKKCFWKIQNISASEGFSVYLGGKSILDRNNGVYDIGDNIIVLGASREGVETNITVDCSKGISMVNIHDSLLDLWLSLNGYSTNEAKADWCNEHIPPFEGTYDLVLGMKDSLMLKATCGQHTSSVLFKKAIGTRLIRDSLVTNGKNFTRYADGTMLCYGIEKQKTGSLSVNYPMPMEEVTFLNAKTDSATLAITEKKTTGFTVNVEGTADVSWIAIGRWK